MNKKKDIFNPQILTFTHKLKKNLLFLDNPWLITLLVNLFRIRKNYCNNGLNKKSGGLWIDEML